MIDKITHVHNKLKLDSSLITIEHFSFEAVICVNKFNLL